VARPVLRLGAAAGEGDELIAHVDERHARFAFDVAELEQAAVERQGFLEVADLERDVVDPDGASHGTRLALPHPLH
jgi:hypothetical protein